MNDLIEIQAHPIGFKPDEMLDCEKCGKKTPPSRLKCFYCGAELKVSDAQAAGLKPRLRQMEEWEKGFNVIYKPATGVAVDIAFEAVAEILHLDTDYIRQILECGKPLPLARAETEKEAEVIVNILSELGLESFVLGDESLQTSKPNHRLRGIKVNKDSVLLLLFNSNESIDLAVSELKLIVLGAVYRRTIESDQVMKTKKENRTTETVETTYDEPVMDIYCSAEPIGYRIESSGFDFSCLGDEKRMMARENMKLLSDMLRSVAPNAKYVDDYLKLRAEIGKVWQVEQKTESGGLKRENLIKLKRSTLVAINNISQFTRYSRMQWHLK